MTKATRAIEGDTGTAGAKGDKGDKGDTGPAGPPGAGSAPAYLQGISRNEQVVPAEADVSFDSILVASGIASAGSSAFVVSDAGVYEATILVRGTAAADQTFTIFVNGAPSDFSFQAATSGPTVISGTALLSLTAGDVISLRNHDGGTITIGVKDGTTIAASMVLQGIDTAQP